MYPILVLAVLVPSVFGNCCMPQVFSAASSYSSGSEDIGNTYLYVDFGAKQITVVPIPTSAHVLPALKALRLDFGKGILHKHYNLLDQCSETPYTVLAGFDRCIPDNAKTLVEGPDNGDEYWDYKVSGGMTVKIALDKSDCLPYSFSLEDSSKSHWTEGLVWSAIIDKVTVNTTAPYVKTRGCSHDETDIFG